MKRYLRIRSTWHLAHWATRYSSEKHLPSTVHCGVDWASGPSLTLYTNVGAL